MTATISQFFNKLETDVNCLVNPSSGTSLNNEQLQLSVIFRVAGVALAIITAITMLSKALFLCATAFSLLIAHDAIKVGENISLDNGSLGFRSFFHGIWNDKPYYFKDTLLLKYLA